jgi:hypothetical protein
VLVDAVEVVDVVDEAPVAVVDVEAAAPSTPGFESTEADVVATAKAELATDDVTIAAPAPSHGASTHCEANAAST